MDSHVFSIVKRNHFKERAKASPLRLECQTIFYGDSTQDGTVGQHFVESGLYALFRCFNSLIIKCV